MGLTEEVKEKTAFITSQGLYQFKILPFGLCNAPSTFKRLMERILQGLRWEILLVYLDDVIIFIKSKLIPKKCHLFKREVVCLGHVVSPVGISTNPAKIEVIQNWPTPQDVSDVCSCSGMFGYFQKFIRDYSKKAKPLTKLTDKSVAFVWDLNRKKLDSS